MKKLTVLKTLAAWILCSIFALTPILTNTLAAKSLSWEAAAAGTERQDKINELLQAIENIRQNRGLPEDVRNDSLNTLLNELKPLLSAEIGYLEGQRDAFATSETNATARNAIKQSFDKNINRLKENLENATLEKLTGGAVMAGNNVAALRPRSVGNSSSSESRDEVPAQTATPTPTKTPTPTPTPAPQIKIDDVPEVGDKYVSAKVENADLAKHRLQFVLSGSENDFGKMTLTGNGTSIISNIITGGLKSGQTVTFRVIDEKGDRVSELSVNVFNKINPTESGLFGMLFSGIVTTKQAQSKNEAAPFLGFQVGWGTNVGGVKRSVPTDKYKNKKLLETKDFLSFNQKCTTGEKNTTDWEIEFNALKSETLGKIYERVDDDDFNVSNNKYREFGKDDGCEISFKRDFEPFTGFNTSRTSYRFQGLFSNEGRTGTATPTETPLPAGQPGTPFRFIQHRQSFSPEFTVWHERNPLGQLSYGFYATVGATTALDSNEGNDQLIVDRRTNRQVKSKVISPGGLQFYGEVGSIQHLKFNPGRFLFQNFVGFGYYESFRGTTFKFGTDIPDGRSRFRFVNKLRIFPEGVNVDFGRQISVTPMFGYDLNAGFKGPANVRFFTGFAIKLKAFDGKTVDEK